MTSLGMKYVAVLERIQDEKERISDLFVAYWRNGKVLVDGPVSNWMELIACVERHQGTVVHRDVRTNPEKWDSFVQSWEFHIRGKG